MAYLNRPTRKAVKYNTNTNKAIAQKYVYNTPLWQKLRIEKLINNPLCEICEENSIIKAAEEVHHMIPFMRGKDIAEIQWLGFDYNNLQSLCKKCHDKQHYSH